MGLAKLMTIAAQWIQFAKTVFVYARNTLLFGLIRAYLVSRTCFFNLTSDFESFLYTLRFGSENSDTW